MEGETLRPFIWDFVNTPGYYNRLIAGTAPKRLAGGVEILSENPKEISDIRRMNAIKASASQYRTIVAVIIFSCLIVLALHRWASRRLEPDCRWVWLIFLPTRHCLPWSLPRVYPKLAPGVCLLAFLQGESPPLTRSRGMLAHLLVCRGQ